MPCQKQTTCHPSQLETAISRRAIIRKIRRLACRHPRRIPRPTTYLAFQLKTSSRKIAWKNAIVGVPSSSAMAVVFLLLPGARCFCCCCPFLSVVGCPFLSVVVVHVSHGCCTNSMQEMYVVVSFVRVSTVTGLTIAVVGHPNEQPSHSDIDPTRTHEQRHPPAAVGRRRPSAIAIVVGHGRLVHRRDEARQKKAKNEKSNSTSITHAKHDWGSKPTRTKNKKTPPTETFKIPRRRKSNHRNFAQTPPFRLIPCIARSARLVHFCVIFAPPELRFPSCYVHFTCLMHLDLLQHGASRRTCPKTSMSDFDRQFLGP